MRILLLSLLLLFGCLSDGPIPADGSGMGNSPIEAISTDIEEPPPQDVPGGPTIVQEVGYTLHRDITYAETPQKGLLLDIYIPDNATGALPLIIYIHGGAWKFGSKGQCAGGAMAAEGFAVACINYRLSNESIFPSQIHDVKAAIRFMRANAAGYGIDPKRIGLWGSSAGGHLAALAGTSGDAAELEGTEGTIGTSSRVQAVCDWFGPTDFTVVENITDKGHLYYDYAEAAEALLGGRVADNHAKALEANPITYVSADDPPFMIMHGRKDGTVPYNQSVDLHKSLAGAGVDSTLILYDDLGHGFNTPTDTLDPNAGTDEFDTMLDFFSTHLK